MIKGNISKTNKFVTWTLLCVLLVAALGGGLSFFKESRKPLFGMGENPQTMAIETYIAGDNQPTHPSVVDMKEPWNGYRYWMAYSPYPYAHGEEENPCIAVSNDLENWTVPDGLHNPIAFNEETSCDELKDPHIVYNPDKDQMEVWYLGRINGTLASNVPLSMFRKTSTDGVHWSPYELLIENYNGKLSHSVIWEDGRYKLYGIKPAANSTDARVVLSESPDGLTWTKERDLIFGAVNSPGELWHGSVSKDSIYRFVSIPSGYATAIMYAESKDGEHFSAPREIIHMGNFRNHFYRPHALATDSMFVCIYGVVDFSNKWELAMTTGVSPFQLEDFKSQPQQYDHLIYRYEKYVMSAFSELSLWAIMSVFVVSIIILCMTRGIQIEGLLWLFNWLVIYVTKTGALWSGGLMSLLSLFLSGFLALLITLIATGIKTWTSIRN